MNGIDTVKGTENGIETVTASGSGTAGTPTGTGKGITIAEATETVARGIATDCPTEGKPLSERSAYMSLVFLSLTLEQSRVGSSMQGLNYISGSRYLKLA